jgi:hypothetical protein
MDRNELPLESCHLGVPSGASHGLAQTCTYLAPKLTPSPNKSKRDLIRPTSPMVSIGYIQNDLRAYGTFGANRATILQQD